MRSVVSIVMLALMAIAVMPSDGAAEAKPAQLSLFNPLQIVPEDTAVKYFRFNLIYGKNTTLTGGVDIGLVNHLTAGESMGIQWGFGNWVETDMKGIQWGAVNGTRGTFTGWQWGFVNYSGHTKGFMLGFVNYSESMYGLQIGFVNIIRQDGMLPVFPFFNFSF